MPCILIFSWKVDFPAQFIRFHQLMHLFIHSSIHSFSSICDRCNPYFVRCIKPNHLKVYLQVGWCVQACSAFLFRFVLISVFKKSIYLYMCVCMCVCACTLCTVIGARNVWHGAGQNSAALLRHHGDHPHQEGGLSNQTALSQLPIEVGHLLISKLIVFESSFSASFPQINCFCCPLHSLLSVFKNCSDDWSFFSG